MQIKVFKAGSMKDALAAMKAELGPNAVILHSKKYRESGLLGFRSKEVVEITAALDEDTPASESAPKPASAPPPPPKPNMSPTMANALLSRYKSTTPAPKAAQTESNFKNVFDNETAPVEIESQSDAEILQDEPKNPTKTAASKIDKSEPKPKSESLRMPTEDESPEQAKIRRLEGELAQMKAMLAEVLGKESAKGGISLHEALKMQEVSEEILTEMASNAGAGDTLVDCQSSAAKWTLSTYINEHLKFSDGIKLNRHGVRIVALLGTTGVGKTTTLAKIAARFVLDSNSSLALITADTYRISAVEQLKTYSDILGLPLEVVYTPQELANAIEQYKNKDLILIDTAGRSQHNDFQMKELVDFLAVNPRIEKHLVLSSTTKLTDAQEILKRFSAVAPEKIIITKIDETGSLGMVLNLLRNENMSISYVTTGQSVPDDIEVASADVLTNIFIRKAAGLKS